MFLTVLLVALGIAGACAGSLLARRVVGLHRLTSITAGLFFGMAALLVIPEALQSGPWPIVAVFALIGCVAFAWLEWQLHQSLHANERTGWAPALWVIFTLIATHNVLDGWNIGVAMQVPSKSFAAAFSVGMGFHKLVGGLAVGALLRRPARSPLVNLSIAASAEALTLLGVLAQSVLIRQIGQGWTVWFLAATGGSFLFLAFQTLAESRRTATLRETMSYGALGFLIIAFAAGLERV